MKNNLCPVSNTSINDPKDSTIFIDREMEFRSPIVSDVKNYSQAFSNCNASNANNSAVNKEFATGEGKNDSETNSDKKTDSEPDKAFGKESVGQGYQTNSTNSNDPSDKKNTTKYITNPYGIEDYFNYYFNREYNPKNNETIHVNNQNMKLSTYIIFKFLDEKYNSQPVPNSSNLGLTPLNNLSMTNSSSKYQYSNSTFHSNYSYPQKQPINTINTNTNFSNSTNLNNFTGLSNFSINTANSIPSMYTSNHSFNPHYNNPLLVPQNQIGHNVKHNPSHNSITQFNNNIPQSSTNNYFKPQLGVNSVNSINPMNSHLTHLGSNLHNNNMTGMSNSIVSNYNLNTNFNGNSNVSGISNGIPSQNPYQNNVNLNLSLKNNNVNLGGMNSMSNFGIYGNYYKQGNFPDKSSL